MNTFWQDIRYAMRGLGRNPGFTLVTVVTLAFGIGANSAIFSVVNTVLLKPLPYRDPAGLVKVWTRFTGIGLPNDQNWFSAPEFRDLSEQNRSFSAISVLSPSTFNLGLGGGNPQSVTGAAVSPALFTILGINPPVGRTFLPEEAQQGRDRVVILGYGLWQRAFGADPQIVSKASSMAEAARLSGLCRRASTIRRRPNSGCRRFLSLPILRRIIAAITGTKFSPV